MQRTHGTIRRYGSTLLAAAAVLGLTGPAHAAARDMCKMLKDKGVLDELEYNECKASQEKEEGTLVKSLQDFAKEWISYKEGTGFVINSAQNAPQDYRNQTPKPKFSFSLGNRIQTRFTYQSRDGASRDDTSNFRVQRFKTFMSGNAFYPWLKYKFQANWVGHNESASNTQQPDLEDALIDVVYFPFLAPQIGQYKVPFNRQELTSSGAQQFVDRAITNNRFSFGRDQGFMLHGMLGEEKKEWFEYGAGVFNGNGRNKPSNDNNEYMGVFRLYWTPMGPFKYSESDTDNTPNPLPAFGLAGAYDPVTSSSSSTTNLTTTVPDPANPGQTVTWMTGSRTVTTQSNADIYRLTADGSFKWRGFSTFVDYFLESRGNKNPNVTVTQTGTGSPSFRPPASPNTVNTWGINAQAGYFILPRHVEVAARYAMFDPDGPSNRQDEVRGGINWFIYAHNLKLQTDFGQVAQQQPNAKNIHDFEVRTQMQLIF